MRKVTPITEQFQHFVQDLKETFLGGRVRQDARAVEEVFGGAVGAAAGELIWVWGGMNGRRKKGRITATDFTHGIW